MELQTLSYTRAGGWSAPLPDWDSPRTLVLAFGAAEYGDLSEPFAELERRFPSADLLGCSTAGEILGTKISDGSVSVAVARFDRVELRSAMTTIASPGDSFDAGQRIARELGTPGLRSMLLLSDGLNVNGSALVSGAASVVPGGVVVTGGLAGDGDRFKRTWVLDGARPAARTLSAVGFYGDDLRIGHGSKGGWDIFGLERVVTRSRGNVLYELDGRPALDLYKEYLGERAKGLPATALLFPLSLRSGAASTRSVVRTVLAVDEEAKSMTFAGDVPQGSLVQLMRANFDRLVQGASDAAALTLAEHDGKPVLAIAISCVGRRLVLGERTEEEIDATLDVLPAGTQQVGFYSYGEISPHASGSCDLHNQTMTLTTLGEQ